MREIKCVLIPLLVSACGYDPGACVLVSPVPFEVERGEYIRFDGGAHWYSVNGKIKAIHGINARITGCEEEV